MSDQTIVEVESVLPVMMVRPESTVAGTWKGTMGVRYRFGGFVRLGNQLVEELSLSSEPDVLPERLRVPEDTRRVKIYHGIDSLGFDKVIGIRSADSTE